MLVHEPTVALTDLALAFESGLFVWLLAGHGRDGGLRRAFQILFAALACAALLGFVVHGLVSDKASLLYQVAWTSTLLSIGVVALAIVFIAMSLWGNPVLRNRIVGITLAVMAGYTILVIIGYRNFAMAVAVYVPAVVLLLVGFAAHYWRKRTAGGLLGLMGTLLSLLAAATQQSGIRFLGLDHNSIYHLIQGLALWILYLSARRLL